MAKKHLISSGRWHTKKVNQLGSLESKIVFEYLLSNPLTSRSGIYTIYSGGISEGIGRKLLSAERVREVILKDLEKQELIQYEHEDDIVYILDFHKYIPFGNGKPHIIASELLMDFEEYDFIKNPRCKTFWDDYVNKNSSKLLALEDKLCRPGNKGNPDKITIKSLLNLINKS